MLGEMFGEEKGKFAGRGSVEFLGEVDERGTDVAAFHSAFDVSCG